MDLHNACLTLCAAFLVGYFLRQRRRWSSVRDVPGPETPSWVFGHQWYFQNEEAGVVEKNFLERYGNVVRWRGPFGDDRLWVSDPKAIHHILHKGGYNYAKSKDEREQARLITDYSVGWADGEVHRRHRRAMTPAFGTANIKDLLPTFMKFANKLTDKWHDVIENEESRDSATIDANMWFGKATLDAIGAGAFEYDFSSLDNTDNLLARSYQNLFVEVFGGATKGITFIMDIIRWLPSGLLTWLLFDIRALPEMENLRLNRKEAHIVARRLIEAKRQELKDGTARKDILSSLVKAGATQRPDSSMSDDEIVAQVRGLMLAGHETTAKSLTFAIWELAKHPEFQEKLRAEICGALEMVRARGGVNFDVNDFGNMPHLVAVIKETLRMHPIAVDIPMRMSRAADILPLTKPFIGLSGKVYNELPIPAGATIVISTFGYNQNPDLWGPNAYEFRPERWFDMNEKPESPVGMYGNLVTFSGGVRSCLGWRFSVVEMQAFIVTLVRQFKFSLADGNPPIRRRRPGILVPMVAGEEEKGAQLPIKVTALRND
ncbi:cytochrome P450 [Thelephora ganbajun]|uniref:Cytochrome P450 n=1 Tax=Thelephora ganbajun TaxID=370292 RepID=A0ACB6ZCM2_THEGA|nr:cytochrome P450 [Thelephora ganbajun]